MNRLGWAASVVWYVSGVVSLLGLSCFGAQAIELISNNKTMFEQAVSEKIMMAGLELMLVVKENEQLIPPTYQLQNGDRIRFRLRTSVASEFQLQLLDKQGKAVQSTLFAGQTKAAESTLVPDPQRGVFELDAKPGVEWLRLVIIAAGGVPKALAVEHPHGKIEQIILRHIELLSPPQQQVQYDPLSQIIYFFHKQAKAEHNQISLTLGLNHSDVVESDNGPPLKR